MTRWMHPPELARGGQGDPFEAVAEGARYRLPRELSLALWERACAGATDGAGRCNVDEAKRRFHDLASRIAARGGRLRPDVGRMTLVQDELERDVARAIVVDELVPRAPGRETQVAAETRRWAATNGEPIAVLELPRGAGTLGQDERAPGSDPPGIDAVMQAMTALRSSGRAAPRAPSVAAPRTRGSKPPGFDARVAARGPGGLPGRAVLASWERADSAATAEERLRESGALLDGSGSAPLAGLGRDGGEPLPDPLREGVERLFGHDFSHVRVHTDSAAAQAASELGARALTVGHHVYFGPGSFRPGTPDGDRLLVHELTHVVQHDRGALDQGSGDGVQVSHPSDPVEQEAAAMEPRASTLHEPGVETPARSQRTPSSAPQRSRVVARKVEPSADLSTPTLLSMILGRLRKLTAQAPALEILRRRVQQDLETPPPDTARLRRYADHLNDELVAVEPSLASLATLKKPENYLPTIAARIVERATSIEGELVAALTAAYSNIALSNQLLGNAQVGLSGFADFVVDETLGRNGLEKLIARVMPLREEVKLARARTGRAIITRRADNMAGFALPHHLGELEGELRLGLAAIRSSRRSGDAVGKRLRELIEDTRASTTLISALAAHEQFIYWSRLLDDSMFGGGEPRDLAHRYRDEFDAVLRAFESSLDAKTIDQHRRIVQAAADRFDAIAGREELQKAVKVIEGRLGTISTVHLIAKVIVITAAAGIIGGIAGGAAAGLAGEIGLGAAAGAIGFGAEVLAFTAVSRAGENALIGPTHDSLGKDLAVNALMLGVLKTVNRVFARVFALGANPKTFAKVAYKLGNVTTIAVTLQALAEAQFVYEHQGKAMSGDERTRTIAQNVVMIAAFELGHFIARAPRARGLGPVEAKLGKQLGALRGERVVIAAQLDALQAGKLKPAQVNELLAKIQDLYARELQLLEAAAKQGVTEPALREAIDAYHKQIAAVELKLARAGVASGQTGPQLFRQVRAGVVGFTKAGRSVIEGFYKEQGGTLVPGEKPGELVGTLPNGEKTYFLPEELVKNEQRARAEERKIEDRRKHLLDRIGEAVGAEALARFEGLATEALERLGKRTGPALAKLRAIEPEELGKLLGLSDPALDHLLALSAEQLGSVSKLAPDHLGKLGPLEGQRLVNLARRDLAELRRILALDPADVKVLSELKLGHVTELLGVSPTSAHLRACARVCDRFIKSGIPEKAAVERTIDMAEVDAERLLLVGARFQPGAVHARQQVLHAERAQSHELAQAIDFIRLKGGGGHFEFGKQGLEGVEGHYLPEGAKQRIPVSMKVFSTADAKNVLERADTNAGHVEGQGQAELFAYTNADGKAIYELAKTPPPGATAQAVFKRMTFICRDGTLIYDSGRWRPPR